MVSTPSYSHQVPFQPIWKELSLRGHKVTTITTDLIRDPTLVNLTEIDLSSAYVIWNKLAEKVTKQSIFRLMFNFSKMARDLGHNMFSHPQIHALIKNDTETFDVVISEFAMLSTFAFGKRFNCPTIALSSFQPLTFYNTLIGNPNHVVVFPDPLLPQEELSLTEGIRHFLMYLFFNTMQWYNMVIIEEELVDQYFGTDYPPLNEMLRNVSLLLSNSDPIFHKPRPMMPNVIQIGGKVNRLPPKPLPKEVEGQLNSSINGFIYFSLGSNVKSKDLTDETRVTLMETFAELPYTVLWKFEADDLPNKPKNVITQKWLPQQLVLNHPNIKLFITQGGLQSTEEAIYARVPMVALPFFGDQEYNAKSVESRGFGLMVDHRTLKKEEFKTTILEVINNPTYKQKVTDFADVAEDQPMGGLEKAIWWIEYVIRHKGAKHLRSPILDVPNYRYFLLDIIAVLILALILGIVSTPSYSHQVPFQPIWKELSLRGHQVTTITTDLIRDSTLVNLTEIDLSSAYVIWNKNIATMTTQNIFLIMLNFGKITQELGHNMFLHPEIDALIKNGSETFDLVMSEFLMVSTFAFGERFKCPTIALTSLQPLNFHNSLVGNPNHVVLFPDPIMPQEEPNLVGSIRYILMYLFFNVIQWHTMANVEQKLVEKYFGTDYPPITDTLKNISLVFSNSDPIFHKPRPLMPNVIQIGGKVNRLPPKPLPKEVESKLNSSTNGFIYFSLGSNVKSKDLTEETRATLMETFAELPYTVLWKFEAENLPNKPKNVLTQKWLPQEIVLNHPNIKLFITQGGLQSTEEAIYARVPIVVLPFFGDQEFNAKTIQSRGFGLMVNYRTLKKEEFKEAILEVINNPTYKDKVTEFADVAEDQPMGGLEKAIWWTEYVLRHKGAKHLRSPIINVPTYRCAKILGIVSTPSYSHQVPFQPIWKELSLRGHQVTTITTDLIRDSTLVNLTEIDLSSAYVIWNKNIAMMTTQHILRGMFNFGKITQELGHNMFLHPKIDALIKNDSETFDIVMSEFLMVSTFAFGERFKCPTIALTSLQPFSFHNSLVGNPNHVVLFPDPLLPQEELSLGESIRHILMYLFMNIMQWHTMRNVEQKLVDKYFGTDYPPLIDIVKNISLVLSNSDPIFHKPRPLMPNVIQIGGKVNRLPPKPLPKEVESKLNSSTNGFIYFSLGSNVKSKDLTEETRATLMETFAELPYTVLWKFEAENLPNKPKNVLTQKWLPQEIVLNHPNIKLFITQGGLQSTEEAIYARVPIVALPFFGDQEFNAQNIESKGFGLMVNYRTLKKDEFKKTILEVINNPTYKDKVTEFADVAEINPWVV
ncbi:hypothetical protein FQA39_LY15972 [Lamprigera yunnana]|nr:hypothetical protein FQA39_LY15972 [Lamprigera yunnana]